MPHLVKTCGKQVQGGEDASIRPQIVLLHDILVIHLHKQGHVTAVHLAVRAAMSCSMQSSVSQLTAVPSTMPLNTPFTCLLVSHSHESARPGVQQDGRGIAYCVSDVDVGTVGHFHDCRVQVQDVARLPS